MTGRLERVVRICVLLVALVVPLVFDPTRDEVFAPVKIQVMLALLGVALVTTAGAALAGRLPGVRLRPVADLAVVSFAVLEVAGYLHSADRSVSLRGEFPEYQGLVTVLGYVAAYALTRCCAARGPSFGRALLGVLTVVTALVGGYAVLQRLGLDPLWGYSARPFATLGQANSMGALLVVAMPGAAATAVRYRGMLRVGAFAAAVLGTAGLVVSQSRGSLLAVVVAGTAVLALAGRPHRGRALLATAGVLAAVGVLLFLTPTGSGLATSLGQRLTAAGDTATGSTGQHLALAEIGLLVTVDHPVLGLGQDVFPQVAQQYADARLTARQAEALRPYRPESPHNGLLAISAASGVPALLAYLVVVAAAVRRLVGLRRTDRAGVLAELAAVIGYLVSALFVTAEVSSSLVFWMILGAAVSRGSEAVGDSGPSAEVPRP